MTKQILKYFIPALPLLILPALGFIFVEQIFYDLALIYFVFLFVFFLIKQLIDGIMEASVGNWQRLIFVLIFIAFGVFAYFKSIN